MSTEQQEQDRNHTGLIIFLLIVIIGMLLFILYMIYQHRQETIIGRLAQAFGVKKKPVSSSLHSIKSNISNFMNKSFGKKSKTISSRK